MLIALRAMCGQDEVGHGTMRYRVGPDGRVLVPVEVARWLLWNAGFERIDADNAPDACEAATPTRAQHSDAMANRSGPRRCGKRRNGCFTAPAEATVARGAAATGRATGGEANRNGSATPPPMAAPQPDPTGSQQYRAGNAGV